MRITSASPEPMRIAAAARVRQDYPPGPARVDLLLQLGYRPEDSDRAEGPRHVGPNLDRWQLWAEGVRRKLPTRTALLMLWLPGLEMRSENTALRGTSGSADAKAKSRISTQHAARADARKAFMACESAMHRFPGEVRVRVVAYQCGTLQRIDPGNLYHKPVIDCLCERHYGLGIIVDDSARYIQSVHAEYRGAKVRGAKCDAESVGVMLEIRPDGATHGSE